MEEADLQTLLGAISDTGSGTPTWALFLSAVAIILAAAIGARWQRKIARQTLTYNTIVAQMWDKDYIEKRKIFIGTRDKDGGEKLKQLAKPDEETKQEAEAIRLILNNYELTAIGMSKGVLDEEIVRNYQKTNTLRDYERMKPYIEEVRKSFPKAYIEYEALYEKWRKLG